MTTAAQRAKAWREDRKHGLVDDTVTLVQNASHSALWQALSALGPAALEKLRTELSEAPGGLRSLNHERAS